jgi:Hsp70 protein.
LVTSNKGRLSKSQIDKLIEDSKELEIKDELEKRKRRLYYEIDDFCNNIMTNIKNNEFKLSDNDRKIISDDIVKVLNWLKEKYDDREDEEYEKISTIIKKQYGVLILTGNLEQFNVKSLEGDHLDMTTIYGNENDDDEQNIKQVFVDMEDETYGYRGMTEPDKSELKELRQAILDLCYSVLAVISSGNTKISEEHMIELKDYIDDSLLWLHVHEKITKIEYKIKIDEINETCNKIFDYYKKINADVFKTNELISAIKTPRDELENLCLVLQILVQDGAFPINKQVLQQFSDYIKSALAWVYDIDFVSADANSKEKYYDECTIKLNELNNYCADIHQKMQGINLDQKKDLLGNDRVILTGYTESTGDDTQCGTDIISLIRNRQQDLIADMINNNCVDEI